jgi:protein involved in polysaccharide export with SLBB domain
MSAGQALATPPLSSRRQAQEDSEELEEKRQTLEGEVRYAKAKLDSAQKKLSLQTAAGNVEQSDVLNQEINDWEARLRTAKTQLSEIDAELNQLSSGSHGSDSDVIVPGENLEVFVVEDPSFNGRYQVRRGGYVILPQIGRIAVAGKTIDAAEGAVRKALQSSQLQKASVMIERISGSDIESGPMIYLSGEFKNPRPYRIPLGTSPTLISVILSSGGVTDKADLTRVKIMRMAANRGVVEEVNVQKILDGGSLSSDLTLSEGDVVIVPPGQSNLIYVTGNVKRQGSYHLSPGEKLSAYGAILQSGGFSRFAKESGVHVLRAMPDGTKAKLPVDVPAIRKGKRPDVLLQSNDIIVVPEKFFSF